MEDHKVQEQYTYSQKGAPNIPMGVGWWLGESAREGINAS